MSNKEEKKKNYTGLKWLGAILLIGYIFSPRKPLTEEEKNRQQVLKFQLKVISSVTLVVSFITFIIWLVLKYLVPLYYG